MAAFRVVLFVFIFLAVLTFLFYVIGIYSIK